jgi:hypothetical protein
MIYLDACPRRGEIRHVPQIEYVGKSISLYSSAQALANRP